MGAAGVATAGKLLAPRSRLPRLAGESGHPRSAREPGEQLHTLLSLRCCSLPKSRHLQVAMLGLVGTTAATAGLKKAYLSEHFSNALFGCLLGLGFIWVFITFYFIFCISSWKCKNLAKPERPAYGLICPNFSFSLMQSSDI